MGFQTGRNGQTPWVRILVCIKAGPDFEQIVDDDWEHFSLSTDLSYVKRCFGCFDETALETALRLRDSLKATGTAARCGVLSLCPLPSPLYKNLFALGFDRVFAVPFIPENTVPEKSLEFRPVETAVALGKCIGSGSWDLILTGRQAGYADTGTVPLILAEELGVPAITEVEFISPCTNDPAIANSGESAASYITIERSGEKGRERITAELPLLVVMGNSPVQALRAPSLTAQMQAAKRGIEAPFLAGNKMDAVMEISPGETPKLIRERSHKNCRLLPAGNVLSQSAGEIAELLWKWGEQ